MPFVPDRCWADSEVWRNKCPLAALTNNGCRGGDDCEHRAGESPQCMEKVETDVGLCLFHHAQLVPC